MNAIAAIAAIAANDPDSTTTKKLKVPKSVAIEGSQSTSAKKSYAVHTSKPIPNSNEAVLKKTKSSGDVKATQKKLTEAYRAIDMNENQPRSKKLDPIASAPVDDDGDAISTDDSEEEQIDDQTEALLKVFESDDDSVKDPEDQGYEVGDEIPEVGRKLRKEARKAAEKASASGKPGVVYIGRIPHGFYEQEMRQYFSQFGNITNLRLSRNRKTGKSKHFAFVEFESAEVAEIVSKTMDNYLLFGHILKCKLVAPEQLHKDLWVGANKRFKSVPWNKIQGRHLSQAMTVSGWERRMAKEEKRRADKKAAMNLMGYEFETPKLKSVEDVVKKNQQALTKPVGDASDEELDEEEPKTIEAPKEKETQALTVKNKTDKKEKNDIVAAPKPTNGVAEAAENFPVVKEEASKKKKKNKRAKSSDKLAGAEELKTPAPAKNTDSGAADKVKKVKRSKIHAS